MPDPKQPLYLNLSTLGRLTPPTNPGPGWVGPERPAESWADVKADPLSALFDLGRGAVTGDAPAGMNVRGLGALLAAAMPVAQGAKALRAATKAAKLSELTEEAAQQGIKAYHGSPHDFDQFSLEKIGTGEGAQAYGHGLYFAEHPATAEGYRSSLAGQPEIKLLKVGNKTAGQHNDFDYSPRGNSTYENIQSSLIEDLLIDQQGTLGVPPDQLQAHVLKTLDGKIADYEKEWPQAVADAKRLRADLAKRGAIKLEMGERPGKTYEVQIHASPDQFLDWDKPFSDQPKNVRDALAKLDPDTYKPGGADYDANETGQQTYHRLMRTYGESKVSAMLAGPDMRVPGIRYLDAGSRAGGEGTRNFVVFDDSLVSILKKYGIALPVIEGLRERAKQNGGVISRQDVDSLQ